MHQMRRRGGRQVPSATWRRSMKELKEQGLVPTDLGVKVTTSGDRGLVQETHVPHWVTLRREKE